MSIPLSEIRQPFEVVIDNFWRCPHCDGAFRTGTLRVDQPCPHCGLPTGYLREFFDRRTVNTAAGLTQSYYHRKPAGFEIYGADETKVAVVVLFCVFLEALFSQLMRSVLLRKGIAPDDVDEAVYMPRNWHRKLTWFKEETGVRWGDLVLDLSHHEPLVPETQVRMRKLIDTRNDFIHAKAASIEPDAALEALDLLYPALYFFAATHNRLLGLGPPDAGDVNADEE